MLHENECRLCDLSPSEHIYDKSLALSLKSKEFSNEFK